MTDTEALIEELRGLEAKATPGPWEHYNEVFRPQFGQRRITEIQRKDGKSIINWGGFDGLPNVTARKANANVALIVAMRNALPQILAALTANQPSPAEGLVRKAFNPMPLTEGLHQRCDDSYFSVYRRAQCEGEAGGWYWDSAYRDGASDGEITGGPFATVERAAEAGWEGDYALPEASTPVGYVLPEGWVAVPREPDPALIAATLPKVDNPTDADKAVAKSALEILGGDFEPIGLTVAAELVRDYRSLLASIPAVDPVCHICGAVYPTEHGDICSAAWPDDPKRSWPFPAVDPAGLEGE